MQPRTFIDVPYSERELAKAKGAHWDATLRSWYVLENIELEPFATWLPKVEPSFQTYGKLYFVESPFQCWECNQSAIVVTLASDGYVDIKTGEIIESFATYSFIDLLPSAFRMAMQTRHPYYYKNYSKTVCQFYFMNHCSCRAKFGDFYLYEEPGTPFFPTKRVEARDMSLVRINDFSNLMISASIGKISEDLLIKYARGKSC